MLQVGLTAYNSYMQIIIMSSQGTFLGNRTQLTFTYKLTYCKLLNCFSKQIKSLHMNKLYCYHKVSTAL